jgi:hypothetical protein
MIKHTGTSRRAWLAGSLVSFWAFRTRAAGPESDPSNTAEEIRLIQAKAARAGLGRFRSTETEQYLGIGDGPDLYRKTALGICQQLGRVYQKHFRDKGFTVEFPKRRLTVVTLKDRSAYEKLLGDAPGSDVGGHFDLESNRLVIFDFRPQDGEPVANAERVNLFTLIHEALHQLTFNTGLLSLKADVPRAISEGLATYGESWRPKGGSAFGLHNPFRAEVLANAADLARDWVPVDRLLTNDSLFDEAESEQLAYAQSWVLVQYLLRTSTRVPQFRRYLEALRGRTDDKSRLNDAREHFHDLDQLDRDSRKHAAKAMRGK